VILNLFGNFVNVSLLFFKFRITLNVINIQNEYFQDKLNIATAKEK